MSFHKVDSVVIRGPARVLYSPQVVPFPTKIADIINLTTFDSEYGWYDLGSTKGGANISINDQDKDYKTIEQSGDGFDSAIVNEMSREVSVNTSFADLNMNVIDFLLYGDTKDVFGHSWADADALLLNEPDRYGVAVLGTDHYGATLVDEHGVYGYSDYGINYYGDVDISTVINIPTTNSYVNRIALLTMDNVGLIRAYIFRRALTLLNGANFNFQKTGDQQNLAVRFRCYPDSTIRDINKSYFVVREQTGFGAAVA